MRKALLYLLFNISHRLGEALGFGARRSKPLQNTLAVPAADAIDDAVISAFSQGSEVAFKQIYDHHAPAIYRVVSRYLRSPALAEDLLLELFSEFWRKKETYHDAAHLRLSLFTMARNLAIKYLGKVTAEVLSGHCANGQDRGIATPDIMPLREAASRQNIRCNMDRAEVATPCIAVWRSHNVGPVR